MQKQMSASGFALLIAVIFMSVVLTLGLALGSLGYKQQILASSAIESQHAFYAADAALECALYADQQQGFFDYATHSQSTKPGFIACGGAFGWRLSPSDYSYNSGVNGRLIDVQRLSLNDEKQCADVTIYKYKNPNPITGIVTYIFSQGYDVPCSSLSVQGARIVSRGINIHY